MQDMIIGGIGSAVMIGLPCFLPEALLLTLLGRARMEQLAEVIVGLFGAKVLCSTVVFGIAERMPRLDTPSADDLLAAGAATVYVVLVVALIRYVLKRSWWLTCSLSIGLTLMPLWLMHYLNSLRWS